MTDRANLAASPTMQRALREAFEDPRIEDVEHRLFYGEPDDWRDGQARYEDDNVWRTA